MTITDFNFPQAECITMLIQNVPAGLVELHHHSVNVGTIDAPQLRAGNLQGDGNVGYAGRKRDRMALVGDRLVVRTEGGGKNRNLRRPLPVVHQEDSVLHDGAILLNLAAYFLTTDFD